MSQKNRAKREARRPVRESDLPRDGHFCPVCRCSYPHAAPNWNGMAANNQRLARDLRVKQSQLNVLRGMAP